LYGSKLTDYAVYLVVRSLVCVVQAVRLETAEKCAVALAWFFCRVVPIRRKVIDGNLQIAFPDWPLERRRQTARAMWEHLFLMVAEIAHASRKIHVTNWRRHVRLVNARPMIAALVDERPCVLVTGHYGNFELSGYVLGMFGFPTYTVARPLDNPHLNRFVNRFRGSRGQHILPKQGSGPEIAEMLAAGGTLALLADQSAGPRGCFVPFFGRPASTHKAIAVFGLHHDAPLVLGYARRRGRPLCYDMGAETVIDPRGLGNASSPVQTLTERFSRGLEAVIRHDPDQYWWIHRRWKETPPVRKARQAA
jgi:KDO2-lipid IV(A) lauroyltransferase